MNQKVPSPAATTSFSGLELHPEIQKALKQEGYTTPTPIQAQAIPALLAGKDVLGCAQTGTGKTAAFTLPLLNHLARQPKKGISGRPRALILTPTRELAAQIGDSIKAYGRHLHLSHTVIYGGVGQFPQVDALRKGRDIVVATPGRLLDLMQQRHIFLDQVEFVILDEADRMMDMGFIHDIKRIISLLPPKRQAAFFSATLSPEIVTLARQMVHDPVQITIKSEPTVDRIAQKVYSVAKKDKDALLISLLSDEKIDKVIVFTQMKHVANKVTDKLLGSRIPASAIHGNKSQSARMDALSEFKRGRIRVLVATDVAARGIDVDKITHVINYDLPTTPESYVHRIGRTARAGAEGDAISFCSPEERMQLKDIERFIKRQLPVEVAKGFAPLSPEAQQYSNTQQVPQKKHYSDRVPSHGTHRSGDRQHRLGQKTGSPQRDGERAAHKYRRPAYTDSNMARPQRHADERSGQPFQKKHFVKRPSGFAKDGVAPAKRYDRSPREETAPVFSKSRPRRWGPRPTGQKPHGARQQRARNRRR